MKTKRTLKAIALALALAATVTAQTPQQTPQPTPQPEKQQRGGILSKIFGSDSKTKKDTQKKDAQNSDAQQNDAPKNDAASNSSAQTTGQNGAAPTTAQQPASQTSEQPSADKTNGLPANVPADIQAARRGDSADDEAAALAPYYNSFLSTYRLGPEDVISVLVLGQERYSKSNITVPPNGTISYPLIPEGVFVVGKTTKQVQDELTKRLDEFIIDPQITVTLEKAVSATYSVVGDVGKPGVQPMTHRVSITEALAVAGGVSNTGDKSKVAILRLQRDGTPKLILVNVKEIEKGRAKEIAFLQPGDQVIVPGNRLKSVTQVLTVLQALTFARVFAGGW